MSTVRTKTESKVVTSTSTPMRDLGICATCNHVRTCLFQQASHHPVWYCDEFDDTNSSSASEQPAAVAVPKPADHYFGEAIRVGLCVNCEARTGCSYRKPGVTVVECENYM
jgi:hypothetical protein